MRINLVHPSELTDQHLRAEHLEITLVADALRRTLASARGFVPSKVPEHFTLNSGHAYFFYDKGLYLNKRYVALAKEIRARGFRADIQFPGWPLHLYKDWAPRGIDIRVIRTRIAERVRLKPDWYRYRSSPLSDQQQALYYFYATSFPTTFK